RSYFVVLADHASIKRQLKLEDLRTERGFLGMLFRDLHTQQKRLEYILTDLTRSIRGLEFDVKVHSDLERKQQNIVGRGVNPTSGSKAIDREPAGDKKSPKVGDFSD
ncbi:hypothetical protein KR018_006702, partial [Drosophila ironensis]